MDFWIDGYNPISALIAEKAGFDGIWVSSFAVSTSMGVRDANELSWMQMMDIMDNITDVVKIPVIFDADTGYGDHHIIKIVARKAQKRGVNSICIEDKIFPKRNSFLEQADPLCPVAEFCDRISSAKEATADPAFSIIARCEALVAGHTMSEALDRCHAYCDAGADKIFIHSKKTDAKEILEFCQRWQRDVPVVICPTKYYQTPVELFKKAGVSTVIWANHNIRSSIHAMMEASKSIFEKGSPVDIQDKISSMQDVFEMIGYDDYLLPKKKVKLHEA